MNILIRGKRGLCVAILSAVNQMSLLTNLKHGTKNNPKAICYVGAKLIVISQLATVARRFNLLRLQPIDMSPQLSFSLL